MNFREELAKGQESGLFTKEEVADEFGIPPASVERWSRGVSVPDPEVQEIILQYIKRKTDR